MLRQGPFGPPFVLYTLKYLFWIMFFLVFGSIYGFFYFNNYRCFWSWLYFRPPLMSPTIFWQAIFRVPRQVKSFFSGENRFLHDAIEQSCNSKFLSAHILKLIFFIKATYTVFRKTYRKPKRADLTSCGHNI